MKEKKEVSYYAKIFFDPQDQLYLVEFPDLEGCFTYGKTLEEAKEMAKEAMTLYLDCSKGELPKASKIEGDNIFEIKTILGVTTYTKYHKKNYEKKKPSILENKKQKESEMLKNGFKNFKTFLPKETVLKLDKIVKNTKTSRQVYLTKLIEDEFKKFPVLIEK